jgi:hypothetical protein
MPTEMTLRDYFAGQALAAFSEVATTTDVSDSIFFCEPGEIADRCYAIADAMVKLSDGGNR